MHNKLIFILFLNLLLLKSEAGMVSDKSKSLNKTNVIRELDWSVGEIMATIKRLNISDNTIVIFMSENAHWCGDNTGGFKGMKATTWVGGIRVPFIIRYPKIFPNKATFDFPCWSPDIFPTLLALSNIKPSVEKILDGKDITEILKGKRTEHAPVKTSITKYCHTDKSLKVSYIEYL
jgi:arylsulfatase A-like enzyme